MRYILWLIVALVIILGGRIYAMWIADETDTFVRNSAREMKAAGVPELQNVDIDTANFRDMKITLPASMRTRVMTAAWLLNGWYIWMPGVLLACLSIAVLSGRGDSAKPTSDASIGIGR